MAIFRLFKIPVMCDANQKSTLVNDTQLISRWRMQFGLRYSF